MSVEFLVIYPCLKRVGVREAWIEVVEEESVVFYAVFRWKLPFIRA
jgi:hypothetical protein